MKKFYVFKVTGFEIITGEKTEKGEGDRSFLKYEENKSDAINSGVIDLLISMSIDKNDDDNLKEVIIDENNGVITTKSQEEGEEIIIKIMFEVIDCDFIHH